MPIRCVIALPRFTALVRPSRWTGWAVLALLACSPSAAHAHETQVLVKLVAGSDDGARIAAEASGIAGVPVRYVSAVSRQWHSLVLKCATAAVCDTAVRRLADTRSVYAAIERDERKRIEPSP